LLRSFMCIDDVVSVAGSLFSDVILWSHNRGILETSMTGR